MIAMTLMQKIVSLFFMMFAGTALVRLKLLDADDSRVLSVISIYLITPCVILTAFQVDCTPDVRNGLLLATVAAVLVHIVLIGVCWPLGRLLRFTPVEKDSIIYSNAGNLVIPLVSVLLGPEYVIYSSAFVAVQLILMWSHGKAVLCGDTRFDFMKIMKNVNMISILIGILLFVTGIRFPGPMQDAMNSIGAMIAPAAMFVTGMLIGNMEVKKMLSYHRVWMVCAMRLLITPILCMLMILMLHLSQYAAEGVKILMITTLAYIAPSACSITQMSQIFGQDADYASVINVISTLLCVLTMPLMIGIYSILIV